MLEGTGIPEGGVGWGVAGKLYLSHYGHHYPSLQYEGQRCQSLKIFSLNPPPPPHTHTKKKRRGGGGGGGRRGLGGGGEGVYIDKNVHKPQERGE